MVPNEVIRRIGLTLLGVLPLWFQLTPARAIGDVRPESIEPSPPVVQIHNSWKLDEEISWYGPGFYGRRTACGLPLTTKLVGVAHRSLPCGTLIEFRWKNHTIIVPVVDRGPYIQGRIFDLTGAACLALEHCFTGPIEWRKVSGT